MYFGQAGQTFADSGSTGTATHAPVVAPSAHVWAAFEFEIESVGATPTVDFTVQGSLNGLNWYDLFYVTDSTDTASAAARTVTTVGTYVNFIANAGSRRYMHYRLVTENNTNVTYAARAYFG